VQGQEEWHVSSPESLSISLKGLRQSAKQMGQRNHWLNSEIKLLEMKIESNRRRKFSSNQFSSLKETNTTTLNSGQFPINVKHPMNKKFNSDGDAKFLKKDRLLKDIAMLTDEVESMEHLINQESVRAAAPQVKESLMSEIETVQLNIEDLERKIQIIDRQNSKSLEFYESQQEKNSLLKQKYSLLNEDFLKGEASEKEILGNLKNMEMQNAQYINEMHKSIAELRSEGVSLNKILNKAGKKIKEKNAVFDISDEDIELLMENYNFIEKENKTLKDKYIRIQSDFKKFDQSAQNL